MFRFENKKYYSFKNREIKIVLAIVFLCIISFFSSSCLTVTFKSADGACNLTYTGTSIIGTESLTYTNLNGNYVCTGSGQNLMALAAQIAPLVAAFGVKHPPAAADLNPQIINQNQD